jgi:hypothetical protein
MKKNCKKAIILFIGGLGVIPILMAVFTSFLDFGLALVIAFVFFLFAGTLNGLIMVTPGQLGPIALYHQQKHAVTSLIGGIGVLTILMSLFVPSLSFEYAIVIAYCFFLISGVLTALIEVKPFETKEKKAYSYDDDISIDLDKKSSTKDLITRCSSCGCQMEADSLFCNTCGAQLTG